MALAFSSCVPLSICPSSCVHICLYYTYLSFSSRLSIYQSVRLSVCLWSVSLYISPSLSIYVSIYLSIWIYRSICLSIYSSTPLSSLQAVRGLKEGIVSIASGDMLRSEAKTRRPSLAVSFPFDSSYFIGTPLPRLQAGRQEMSRVLCDLPGMPSRLSTVSVAVPCGPSQR